MLRAVHIVGSLALAALLVPGAARAASTPESKCQAARYKEAGKYAACQQKVASKLYAGKFGADTLTSTFNANFQAALAKCKVKYIAKWTSAQAKAAGTGSTCDGARFTDNGNGTVSDRWTGLQWEQKTDDAAIHDKDNTYQWATGFADPKADGDAFTTFFATLNGATCFTGSCDWRLPTLMELQTILNDEYPCGSSPCTYNAFGPTSTANSYATATVVTDPLLAGTIWFVAFDSGASSLTNNYDPFAVRAVRGGL